MSVFGGDSWGREAQHPKRKVDQLLLSSPSSSSSSSSFKKLSSGKFVCLVCPHNPVLDSPLMLSVHNKGSRHVAAQTKLKEKELWRQQELNKRIALTSESKIQPKNIGSNGQVKTSVEQTRIAILELQSSKFELHAKDAASDGSNSTMSSSERREKELKFIAAGWKKDCRGKWYRDENTYRTRQKNKLQLLFLYYGENDVQEFFKTHAKELETSFLSLMNNGHGHISNNRFFFG